MQMPMTVVDVYESLHHKIITCLDSNCVSYNYNNFSCIFLLQCYISPAF